LVLNSGNGTLGSPVDGGWDSDHDVFNFRDDLGEVHAVVDRNEFFAGKISKLVQSNRIALGLFVVVSDKFSGFGKDGKSVSMFLGGGVHLVVGGHP